MGGGSWTSEDFKSYSTLTKGCEVKTDGSLDLGKRSVNQVYKQKHLDESMHPIGKIRECRDTEEHPNTIPVILALDVTGSMGQTALNIAADLGKIMESVYKEIPDVEFMIMGIGDFFFDYAPLQVSQFESDIRIAEWLDKLYFEFGGGPNSSESYTAAWLFGITQVDLDCWERGKKGLIITIGDEYPNVNLPYSIYHEYMKPPQTIKKIDINSLYKEAKKKYDIYHINIEKGYYDAQRKWIKYLEEDKVISCSEDKVTQIIPKIILNFAENQLSGESEVETTVSNKGEISW